MTHLAPLQNAVLSAGVFHMKRQLFFVIVIVSSGIRVWHSLMTDCSPAYSL